MRIILGLLAMLTLVASVFFMIDGFTVYSNAGSSIHQIIGMIDFVVASILWGTWMVCGFITVNKAK